MLQAPGPATVSGSRSHLARHAATCRHRVYQGIKWTRCWPADHSGSRCVGQTVAKHGDLIISMPKRGKQRDAPCPAWRRRRIVSPRDATKSRRSTSHDTAKPTTRPQKAAPMFSSPRSATVTRKLTSAPSVKRSLCLGQRIHPAGPADGQHLGEAVPARQHRRRRPSRHLRRSAASRPTATASTTWPATSGNGPRPGTAPETAAAPRTTRSGRTSWRAATRASLAYRRR